MSLNTEATVEVEIKPKDGVDGLYAPRRTVLDPILVHGAEAAGAEVVHGHSVVDAAWDDDGRVRGVTVAGRDQQTTEVATDLLIGADGIRSRVARIVGAPVDYAVPHTTAAIYGYRENLGLEGFQWFYQVGASVGAIPTNDGNTCVFASLSDSRFADGRSEGLESLYTEVLNDVSSELAQRVADGDGDGKLRAFAGTPGFLRRSAGPGWALVGDAGYFKDPITAHAASRCRTRRLRW